MKELYIHDPNVVYPKVDSNHMIKCEKVHDYVYDENFMYRLNSFKYRFIKFWAKFVILTIVKPFCYIRYGLKIEGKKNIKKYLKLNKNKAMISVSNHTTEWDILFVQTSRYFKFTEFPAWQEGIESKSGMLYRVAGGIPVPLTSRRGLAYSYEAMKDVVKEGKWLHIFPEAACWAFYPAVREFQSGSFRLACDMNMPILPMGVKYRKPKGLYKLVKKHPNAKLSIGEPLLINKDLPKKEAIIDLANRARLSVMNLIGIESEEENNQVRAMLKHE